MTYRGARVKVVRQEGDVVFIRFTSGNRKGEVISVGASQIY